MATEPFLSVIIPSYDGRELLAECLPALYRQTLPRERFEIVVVDNASADGSRDWLAAEYPEVRVVPLPENLGFAEGTNRGAAAARGEMLVFLNNDAVAAPGFLQGLSDAAAGADRPACVAARILDVDGREIEFGASSLHIFGLGAQHSSWHRQFREASPGTSLPFACGGAMLIRAAVFAALGGFDADYFAYCEDVDLGWRLWLSGEKVVYAPAAEVRHRRHATGGRFPDRWRHFLWYRNALVTLVKNSGEVSLPRLLPFAIVTFLKRVATLVDAAGQAAAGGDHDRERSLLASAAGAGEGISWVLSNFDQLLEKRRRTESLRRRSDQELAELFELTVDFGPESGFDDNVAVLRLLPFIDLSSLWNAERVLDSSMRAAGRIAEEATALAAEARAELVQWHAKAKRLGEDLDSRNRELLSVHADLHSRNLEARELQAALHSRNGELESLRIRLEEQERRLSDLLSSRSWRWTAPIRRLLAGTSRR